MLPRKVLSFSKNRVDAGEGIVIRVNDVGADSLILHGASMVTSLRVGNQATSFIAYPDKAGVIAIFVRTTDKHGGFKDWQGLFIGIEQDEERKFFVPDHKVWIPSRGRIGQVYNNHIEVNIGGVVYHTQGVWKEHIPGHFVADANLLCRYLTGDVSPEDVEAAAVKIKKELSAREELVQKEQIIARMVEASRKDAVRLRAYDSLETLLRFKGLLDDQVADPSLLEMQFLERFEQMEEELSSLDVALMQIKDIFGMKVQNNDILIRSLKELHRCLVARSEWEQAIGRPLEDLLQEHGLFSPGIRPEYAEEDRGKRIGALIQLAYDIRGLCSDSRLLRWLLRKPYEAYKERAKECAHFAPKL